MSELVELREEYQIANLEFFALPAGWSGAPRSDAAPLLVREGGEWRVKQPYADAIISWPLPAAWQLWLDRGGRWEIEATPTGWLLKYLAAGWRSRLG